MSNISLTGLSSNYPIPGIYVQTNFAQGPAAGNSLTRKALLIGNMTSSGLASVNTVYGPDTPTPIQTDTDWGTQFGFGSPLHRAFQKFAGVDPETPLYAIVVAASEGNSASGHIVVSGPATTAASTGYGNLRTYVQDEFVDTSIANGQTPDVIAEAIESNINSNQDWAVTATVTEASTTIGSGSNTNVLPQATIYITATTGFPTAGTVAIVIGSDTTYVQYTGLGSGTLTGCTGGTGTLATSQTVTLVGDVTVTAKVPGPRGNYIPYMVQMTQPCGVTATPGVDTWLADGTTEDSNTEALAAIDTDEYYYIASEANDATQFGALASQVGTQALPLNGMRQRCFCGFQDTLANGITFATGINNPRAEIVWEEDSDWTPFELASNDMALYAIEENTGDIPRHNFSNFPTNDTDATLWFVPAPRNKSAWPSTPSLVSALNNGLTPIAVNKLKQTYLVCRITSYSLTNSVNDYRIRPAHKVTECDFYADDLQAVLGLNFGGLDLADDPAQGEDPPGPQCTTPGAIQGTVNRQTIDYCEQSRMVNEAQMLAGTIVERDTEADDRVYVFVPLQPVNILNTIGVELNQVA